MINDSFTCARPECGNTGVKTTHNQKYCSPECCRIQTNAKIMEKYHERVAIRKGKKRECRKCGTPLSRYNETKVCSPCTIETRHIIDTELQDMLTQVSWV